MTVNEILRLPAIAIIENEIIDVFNEYERHGFSNCGDKQCIRRLLAVRKRLLDRMFVMDDHYKHLLSDFNKALSDQLLQMRLAVISAYNAVRQTAANHGVETVGKCFLAYQYSTIHPDQSDRRRKVWDILCGAVDDFMPYYSDGVINCGWRYSGGEPESENHMLYLSEQIDNWNHAFDSDMTADMNLIYPLHALYEYTSFSVFDFLWVRNFNVEVAVEYDYATEP